MSWRVLKSIIKYSPRTSALFRELFGDAALWGPTEHLLAANYDINAIIAWLASDTKKNQRPKPITRPGGKDERKSFADTEGALRDEGDFHSSGDAAMTIEEFNAFWAKTPLQIEAGDPDAS